MLTALLVAAIAAPAAFSQLAELQSGQQIADIRQGTNIAVAIAPDGQSLVLDLLGRLWRLPVTGGGVEPLTPEGEHVRNPRYSRDGRYVVYQRLLDGQWDLWQLDVESGMSRALTDSPHNEREPDFHADGKSVVFASDRSGHYCLWSLELDTGVQTQLTEEPGEASFPTVSDLDQVAYVLERRDGSSLRVLTTQGVAVEVLSSSKTISAPSWRPGGAVLLFNELDPPRTSELKMLVLADKPVVKLLTRGEDVFQSRAAWPSSAEYIYTGDGQIWQRGLAENGRRPIHLFAALTVEAARPPSELPALDATQPQRALGIAAHTTARDGRASAFVALGDLWVVERNSVRRLTDDAYVEADPVFTPDGETIVFASDRGGNMDLWRVSVGNGSATQLTFRAGKAYRPAVAPDGQRVAFLETRHGFGPWDESSLHSLALERPGEVQTLATGLVGAERPTWLPDSRTIAADTANGLVHVALGNGTRAAPVAFDDVKRGAPETGYGATAANEGTEPPGVPTLLDLAEELGLEWSVGAGASEPYVIQVGRLFDGVRADYRRHVDIHVERQRVTAIVGRGMLPLPANVIDARESTVMPGLIDVHAHQSSLAGERLGRAWLAYGVTTVRELADDLAEAVERGEAWASGRRLGPRLLVTATSGIQTPPLAAHPVVVHPYANLTESFGHGLTAQARMLGTPIWQEPSLLAALVPSSESVLRYALETSSLDATYQDSLSKISASESVVIPTLAALRGQNGSRSGSRQKLGDPAYELLFDGAEREAWNRAGLAPESIRAVQQTIARLVRGGGRVAVGSDAPAVPYGLGLHIELALLAEAGIPNDQVLRLATAQGALALGLERQLGTIEEGKLADMMVLNGDPLARIADTLSIAAVVKGGTWFDRETLATGP